MNRKPHPTPQPRRSRPDLLDDEGQPPTPKRPPPPLDSEGAAELSRAALRSFLDEGGAAHGVGVVASWDYRIGKLEEGMRALATSAEYHEQAAQLREEEARLRHEKILEIVAQQSGAIATTAGAGAALAARVSAPDRRELSQEGPRSSSHGTPQIPAPTLAPSPRSTWPAALVSAAQSKTKAAAVIGLLLALLALAEKFGLLSP